MTRQGYSNSKNVIHDKNALAWDSDDAVMGMGNEK